jgi:uncharacterized protein Smg (DUF494 family)
MMKEKVVEILIQLMTAMQDQRGMQEIDLSPLKDRGYTPSEINAAFAWLSEHVQGTGPDGVPSPRALRGSRRVLHEAERSAFSTEAQGYLIQLAELGLLDDRDMEAVIERAMGSGYENLPLQDVREIAAGVLINREGSFPAKHHSMLTNEDTIH